MTQTSENIIKRIYERNRPYEIKDINYINRLQKRYDNFVQKKDYKIEIVEDVVVTNPFLQSLLSLICEKKSLQYKKLLELIY